MTHYCISHYWKPIISTKKNSIPTSFTEGHHGYLSIICLFLGKNMLFFPLKSSSCLCKQAWSHDVRRYKNTPTCYYVQLKFINNVIRFKCLHQCSQYFIRGLSRLSYLYPNKQYFQKKKFCSFFLYFLHI